MGTLFICATPIGNLSDISSRLTETLSKVDCIYGEDTRRVLKLLNHLNIKK
ncbi:16S rRNA (cytidine(1402)-2'-O)-methyltransferase, partial [Acidimicrobiia bacterium]|nr:16S rRNA (cytidine(1402)-2'-O)-methyltransferase [Acidimicrobiia bacterium]